MTGPVLLCYDGSADADRAVRRAATLLRPADAVVLPVPRRLFGAHAGIADSGRRVALDAGFERVSVAEAGRRPIVAAVLEQARRHDVSVIVTGADGRPSAPHSSVAGALIQRSGTPVLVLPAGERPEDPEEPILVGYDGSATARRALGTAAALLAGRNAIVVAFMPAVDDVALLRTTLPWPAAAATRDGLARLDREEAVAPGERAAEGAELAAAAGFLPQAAGIAGARASAEEEEEPWRRLRRAAEADAAACIVVGHRTLATPPQSTAHGLVRHAARAVLVVPGAP